MNSSEYQLKIENIIKSGILPNQNSIDQSVKSVNDILVNVAELSGMLLKKGVKPRKPSYKNRFIKVKPPKWQDKTCHEMFLSIKQTALLLNKNPKNSWLLGKIKTETKQYKKLLKSKQSEFINKTFKDLDIGQHAFN